MATELLHALTEAALASSAAVLLVVLLRGVVGRHFGALARYRLWMLVPLAMLAVWVPAPVAPEASRTALVVVAGAAAATVPLTVASAVPLLRADTLATAAWLIGALALALMLWRQQRRYLAALRPGPAESATLHPGLARWRRASVAGAPPALIGALRPWLLLPADFEQRYDPHERELILAHEYQHLRHRDGVVNLLASLLRVLLWFNPLLHFAAARMRFDQELACDAAVMRHHGAQRRRYAFAMLKTQLACASLPIGSHWHATHPLKERVAMLKLPLPSFRTRIIGSTTVACILCAGMAAAWAAQPPRIGAPAADEAIEAVASSDPGAIMLEVLVDEHGTARDVRFADGTDAPWAESAMEVALRTHYEPATDPHGKAVEGWRTVSFAMGGSPDAAPTGADVHYNGMELAGLHSTEPHAQSVPNARPSGKPPRYPSEAIAARDEGRVMLRVLVGTDGKAKQIEVDRAHTHAAHSLVTAAINGASNWMFEPQRVKGEATEGWVQVPINFSLDQRMAGYERITRIPYPQAAQEKRIEGEIVLAVRVDPSGTPSDVQIVHEQPAGVFAAAAARRVRSEWRFQPATVQEEAVASTVQVPILFRLGNSPRATIAIAPGSDALDQLEVRAD